MNNLGDWIAFGCEGQGQLLVWEWQSESYILKQQAHSSAMTSLDYSNDGLYIATGGEDGKVGDTIRQLKKKKKVIEINFEIFYRLKFGILKLAIALSHSPIILP